jgi:hypothetical protein
MGRSSTLGLVVRAAQECLDAGTLVAPDAEQLARACWATAHGVASLEVAGLLQPDVAEDVAELARAGAARRAPAALSPAAAALRTYRRNGRRDEGRCISGDEADEGAGRA